MVYYTNVNEFHHYSGTGLSDAMCLINSTSNVLEHKWQVSLLHKGNTSKEFISPYEYVAL